jgi:hypothetical protein
MLTPRVATHLQVRKTVLNDHGLSPAAGPILGSDGNYYGTALGGGHRPVVKSAVPERVRCFGDDAPQSLVEFFTDNQRMVI